MESKKRESFLDLHGRSNPFYIVVREIFPFGSSACYIYCKDLVVFIDIVYCCIKNLGGCESSSDKPNGSQRL